MTKDKQFYIDRKLNLDLMVSSLDGISKKFSLSRFLVFFVLVVPAAVLAVLDFYPTVFFIVAILALCGFVFICIYHHFAKKKLEYTTTLSAINDEYIARIDGDFSLLRDKGSEFYDEKHDYALDLDVFGDTSLFALYNVSESAFGRKAFADELLFAHVDERSTEEIIRRQGAISELANSVEFLQEYQTIARLGNMRKMPSALLGLATKKDKYPVAFRVLYFVMPVLWFIPLIALIIGATTVAKLVCFPIIVLNLLIMIFLSSRYKVFFSAVKGISDQTDAIHVLFERLEKSNLSNEFTRGLIQSNASATSTKQSVSKGLEVLSRACKVTMLRSQPLFALILNCAFPFDLFCADKLVDWSNKYGEFLSGAISALAAVEAMMSASMVSIASRNSAKPVFVDCDIDSPMNAFFDGRNVFHPLLNPQKAISNSIKLSSQIALITGSNMSGKTTMIRTIGTNCILAYIGANVPADSLTLGRMRIMSSMRIVDSIEENMSTFRAELVRISRIVHASSEKKPLLFLIDEIFRGTNSKDRTDGALTVLKRLSSQEICGLMTTHDYALCNSTLNIMQNVVYYHFAETYNDNEIFFDYLLSDGVSKNSNAQFLMKMVGIE